MIKHRVLSKSARSAPKILDWGGTNGLMGGTEDFLDGGGQASMGGDKGPMGGCDN